jgi:hypothetical protein
MADLTTNPVEMQYIKLDLQTKWRIDDRFTHEKLTTTPTLKFYFNDNKSPHRSANSISRFNSKDEIVNVAKKQCREEDYYWGETANNFWDTVETRVTYDVTPKRRYRKERTYHLNVWYEQELEAAIRKAIAGVEAKYQKKFVKHIDDKIQMADKFYAFVKSKEAAE